MDKLIVRDIRRRPFLWMEREAFARIVLQSDPRKSRVSTRTVLSVYMALAYYENGRSHTVAVRASTIAHQLGISRRQFDRAVKVLCDLKLITVTSGKDNGKPNIYTLLDIVEGEDVGDSPEGLDSSVQPPQGGATPVSKGLDTSVQPPSLKAHRKTLHPKKLKTKPRTLTTRYLLHIKNNIGAFLMC